MRAQSASGATWPRNYRKSSGSKAGTENSANNDISPSSIQNTPKDSGATLKNKPCSHSIISSATNGPSSEHSSTTELIIALKITSTLDSEEHSENSIKSSLLTTPKISRNSNLIYFIGS